MNQSLLAVIKYVVGLGLGLALLYFAFRGANFENLMQEINQARPSWLLFAICVGLLSHFLRAVRWRMQLRASGYNPSTLRTFAAVMITYFVNLAIPRAGEIARCSSLLRSDKIPLSTSLGTVVVERTFDVIILGVLAVVVFALEYDSLYQGLMLFSSESGEVSTESATIPSWLFMIAGLGIFAILLGFVFRRQLLRLPFVAKLVDFANELIQAALSIRNLESPGWFLVYTVLIWFCYMMMSYVGFYAMPSISQLDLNLFYFALVIMVVGGIGFALPSPGGVGSYHAAVVITFLAFGVLADVGATRELGGAFAAIIHAAQVLMMIVVGALAYLYLWLQPRRDARMNKQVPLSES